MDKRLAKRHKREVARAKLGTAPSAPDVRTPEQIQAAREAGKPAAARGSSPNATTAAPSFRNSRRPTGSAAKTDV